MGGHPRTWRLPRAQTGSSDDSLPPAVSVRVVALCCVALRCDSTGAALYLFASCSCAFMMSLLPG